MVKLYEIAEDLRNIIKYGDVFVNTETGEIFNKDKLDQLQLAFRDKVDGCAVIVKELTADAEILKKEAETLLERAKAKENHAKWLKEYIASCLDGQKFESEHTQIGYRKSTSVVIDNETEVPKIYKTIKELVNVDKMALKKALQQGEVAGCHLETKNNIQIK